MNKILHIKRLISVAVVISILIGCSSQTRVLSHPDGAVLTVEGRTIGVTPCMYNDRIPGMPVNKVVLTKEGYIPLETTIAKNSFAFRRLFAFYLLVPLIYLWDYEEVTFYEMKKDPAFKSQN